MWPAILRMMSYCRVKSCPSTDLGITETHKTGPKPTRSHTQPLDPTQDCPAEAELPGVYGQYRPRSQSRCLLSRFSGGGLGTPCPEPEKPLRVLAGDQSRRFPLFWPLTRLGSRVPCDLCVRAKCRQPGKEGRGRPTAGGLLDGNPRGWRAHSE